MSASFESFGPLMVSQLRAEVGHLTAFTQLITPTLLDLEQKKYHSYLAIANQSLYRLLRLTNNVEFTTVPQDVPPRIEGLDLAKLCTSLCDEVISLTQTSGHRFHYECDCVTLLTMGDINLLRRLLLNLISNSLRSAGSSGEVFLRMTTSGERVLFTIWDKGGAEPYPPNDSPVPFPKVDGIGLGLEVARQITLLHEGTLLFDQQEGKGSRATIALPIRPPAPSALLRSPFDSTGGFSPVLVELSGILPSEAFAPLDLE